MMTEIIQELTEVKKTNEITIEWRLTGGQRVKVCRGQKPLIEATTDNKEIDTIKRPEEKKNTP